MSTQTQLLAVSPLDGRYADKVQPLSNITSEYGLIKRRLKVEAEWFLLLGSGILPGVEVFSETQVAFVRDLVESFSPDDAVNVKSIEETTNHDVKSVEMWLKHKLETRPDFSNSLELIHFGITSEDINNIAYALQVRDMRDSVLNPIINEIIQALQLQALQYATIPMLARTHGQPATPTTLGKELKNIVVRIERSETRLANISFFSQI